MHIACPNKIISPDVVYNPSKQHPIINNVYFGLFVRHWRKTDDARPWASSFDSRKQEAGQQEVPNMIGSHLAFEAFHRPGVGTGHYPGIVDE